MEWLFSTPDIDWKAWNEEIKGVDFLTYDPPQLKPSFYRCLWGLNWMTPRSPFCASFPCCGAQVLQNCVVFPCLGGETNKISKPDAWLLKMLRNNSSPKCPEFLKGVWWMRDNVANEVLVTFQSMAWESESRGVKNARYNWTTELNCYGSVLALKAHEHTFQVSPDRKWINIGPGSWIYVLGRFDRLRNPDGTPVPFTPGEDLLRISFRGTTAKGGLVYQYIMRRVAYEGSRGQLVKTAGYDELLERVSLPSVPGICCQLGYCNVPADEYRQIFEPLGDEQIIVYQPAQEPEVTVENASSRASCWTPRRREGGAPETSKYEQVVGSAGQACLSSETLRACSPKSGPLACCA